MTKEQAYIPGMCNINKAEVAYRKKAMWFGVAVSLVLLVALLVIAVPVYVRIILFVPIFIASIGYLQVKNSFCVAYGASGRQNASDESEAAVEVTDTEAQAADKKKARTMNLQALIASIVLTVLTFLIPNFS